MSNPLARGHWGWKVAVIGWMLLLFWLSSRPDIPSPVDLPEWLPIDKIGHFILFGVLASLAYLAGLRPLLAIGLAALYGVSDEVHQMFVPGRTPDVRDWFADVAGAALGVWLVSFPARAQRRSRRPIE